MFGKQIFYGWTVLAIALAALVVVQGFRFAFGVFVTPWETDFQASRSSIGLVASTSFLVYALAQPFVGQATDRYGPRRVMIVGMLITTGGLLVTSVAASTWQVLATYGLLTSVGVGTATLVPATVAAARWFTKHRGLALGIIANGFALGQLAMVPTTVLVVEQIGWRTTLILVAAVLGVVLLPAVLLWLRSDPADLGMEPLGGHSEPVAGARAMVKFDFGVDSPFRRRAFWFIAIPYFVCGLTTAGLVDTHFVPFAQSKAFSTSATAVAVTLLAFGNIVGTLGAGVLADRFNRATLLGLIYGARGVAAILLTLVGDPTTLVLVALFYGIADFATIPPTTALLADYFGKRSFGIVFAWASLSHQLGSATGASLYARLYEATRSYDPAFLTAAAALVVAATLSLLLPTRARPAASGQQAVGGTP